MNIRQRKYDAPVVERRHNAHKRQQTDVFRLRRIRRPLALPEAMREQRRAHATRPGSGV
jgi:hypothetical protein